MIEDLEYPALSTIPEYRVEFDKLTRFQAELRKAEDDLVQMKADWFRSQQIEAQQPGIVLIERAEMLLEGRVPLTLQEGTRKAEDLIAGLRRAIGAQEVVVRQIAFQLSRKAAQRFAEEHKARTKRVLAAFEELRAANMAEISLRASIDALGYSQQLPCMRFEYPAEGPLEPKPNPGGYVYAWHTDITDYLLTPQERQDLEAQKEQEAEANARRRKVARLAAA